MRLCILLIVLLDTLQVLNDGEIAGIRQLILYSLVASIFHCLILNLLICHLISNHRLIPSRVLLLQWHILALLNLFVLKTLCRLLEL